MADRRGINSTFVGLGVVAAVGLLATGVMWVGSDHDGDVPVISPSETTSKTVQPQQPSSSSPWSKGSSDTRSESQSTPSDSPTPSGRDSVPDQKKQDAPIEKVDPQDMLKTELHDVGQVYVIKPGDTLSGISASFGVSVDRIAQANNIVDVNRIYAGSALVIPKF